MEKVVDADDVYKVIKKLRKVIPDLFAKRTNGRTMMISEVVKYEFEKYKDINLYKSLHEKLEKYKDVEPYKQLYEKLEKYKDVEQYKKLYEELEKYKHAIIQKFYDEYEDTFCLGDSLMKSLYSTGTERIQLESEWRTLSDLKVFKCIIYLLFYYANIYDHDNDIYKLNNCWYRYQPKNFDSKIKLFKSFLQSCIDYIDDQSVEIPNITDNEFKLIKQAVKNKNKKCELKDYFYKLSYIDKLCFYILDRNAVSSANEGNNGALCPFKGFKKKASSGKRFSKKLIAIGQSVASLTGANKQKIINKYVNIIGDDENIIGDDENIIGDDKNIIGDVFDEYVQNYNQIKPMTYEWRTHKTKWGTKEDTNNCKHLFITKFKNSQDDMEFLCYCLLLQKYIESKKSLLTDELESNKPVEDELTKYINTAIAALRVTNTKINKYIKCNDYNINLPETGKYIVDVILENNPHKNGGKRFTRKNKKVLQRRRVK